MCGEAASTMLVKSEVAFAKNYHYFDACLHHEFPNCSLASLPCHRYTHTHKKSVIRTLFLLLRKTSTVLTTFYL